MVTVNAWRGVRPADVAHDDAPDRDLRTMFHGALDELDDQLAALVSLVADDVVLVSTAMATGDTSLASAVAAREPMLDRLVRTLERSLPAHFARQQPMAGDLRLLVTAVRLLPELERSRDLVTH